jgi:hypothetical protein
LNNGLVLVEGGANATRVLASAQLYNPATGTFASTGSMNTARFLDTATLLNNGMVLIAGGATGYGVAPLASAELYNPATGTFTLTGSLNNARSAHTATLLSNGMVLIAGGSELSGSLASAELYNPATGTFTLTGSLNNARWGQTATLLNNGVVMIAGGVSSNSSSAELYNPATGTFTLTGSLNTARTAHTATLLNNGTVLIAGGVDDGVALASAELYDPITGLFTLTGNLNNARGNQVAALLDSGFVLVAAGVNGSTSASSLASAELYNPATGTFALTGSLHTARNLATATLLNNGEVLVVGGAASVTGILASAELYKDSGITLSNSELMEEWFEGTPCPPCGVQGNLGTVTFTTGPLLSGSFATGATLGGGGSLTVTGNGTDGVPDAVLFTGVFTGTASWAANTVGKVTYYTLTYTVSGTWVDGTTVYGAGYQLMELSGKNYTNIAGGLDISGVTAP